MKKSQNNTTIKIFTGIVALFFIGQAFYTGITLLMKGANILPKPSNSPFWVLWLAGLGILLVTVARFSPIYASDETQQGFTFRWLRYSALVVGAFGLFAALFWYSLSAARRGDYFGIVFAFVFLAGVVFTAVKQYLELTGRLQPRPFAGKIMENRLSWEILHDPDLALLALTPEQFALILDNRPALEKRLGLSFVSGLLTEPILRLIASRQEELWALPEVDKGWLTGWLIVPKKKPAFAGMIFLNGFPDLEGLSELSYELAPSYQGKGLSTKAVRLMLEWAFKHPFCKGVTMRTTNGPAQAAAMHKFGARQLAQDGRETTWIIESPSKGDTDEQ